MSEQVNTPVKRYMPNPSAGASLSPGSYMFPSDSGAWVKHTDYALMESRALAAEAKAPKWQPMETVPRDGSWFLLVDDDGDYYTAAHDQSPVPGYRVRGLGWISEGAFRESQWLGWMPLPTPPMKEGE